MIMDAIANLVPECLRSGFERGAIDRIPIGSGGP